MQWRFLDSGAGTGAFNMALDEAILSEVEAGRSPPTVRIYGWSPPCITLGHSQDPAVELDLDAVRALGFHVAVRPTGGRAVLHVDELTYSVIASRDAAPWCASRDDSYRAISLALARALAEKGFAVALDRGRVGAGARPAAKVPGRTETPAHAPCFSSTARSEVVSAGRKVIGSAQRRLRSSFLQHGSILVSREHRRIVECLALDARRRSQYLASLDRNAVALEELGRADWRELADGFLERFAAGLGLPFRPGEPTEREWNLMRSRESRHA